MGQSWSAGLFKREATPCGIRTYDEGTGETIHVETNLFRKLDFMDGALTVQQPFVVRDTAGGTEVQNTVAFTNGQLELNTDATNEAQLAGVDFANIYLLDAFKSLNVEAAFTLTSADMTGMEFAFGVGRAHNAAIASTTDYLLARCSGSLALQANCRVASGTAVANTGVKTLVTATTYIMRWAIHNSAAPEFYINGVQQTLASALDISALSATTRKVQAILRIGKEAAATTLGVVTCDYFAFWQRR